MVFTSSLHHVLNGEEVAVGVFNKERSDCVSLPSSTQPSLLQEMFQSALKERYVDVLIIGAGPSGVMGANALVRAGVDVCIVDKRYGPHYPNHLQIGTDFAASYVQQP